RQNPRILAQNARSKRGDSVAGSGRSRIPMLISTHPAFHHWLPGRKVAGGPSIALSGFPELPAGLAHEVASYLNEYDGEGAGRWAAFSSSLVKDLSMNAPERTLLGVPDPCPGCPPGSACCLKHVLSAIARRGNVVLEGT